MISAEIKTENQIEVNTDLSDVMADISGIMHEAIIANMESGTFQPRGDGSASYLGGRGGSIARSLGHESTDMTATAGVFDLLPYSFIHNYGGQIKVSEAQHGFFWYMWKLSGDTMWLAMYKKLRPGDFIEMPKREYIAFTEPLVQEILERLKDQIVTFTKNGETIQ